MSTGSKVIVAMSGGVDSAVAAWQLKEQGYDCVGVFMRLGNQVLADGQRRQGGCCSATDASDARSIAGRLGMPFYVVDFQRDFDRIIEHFVDEYARARTPNPCVVCNTDLKFGKLLRYADTMGAEFVATGHYARIMRQDGQKRLARSRNPAKDQSYVLFGVRREDLSRCLFPLGEIADKAEVRRIAAEVGLRVHDKPESQEICFVPDDDYARLVRQRRPETQQAGDVVDAAGKVVGQHEGVANFTIGQRRGLGIALGQPVYVTQLDPNSNTVRVGARDDLQSNGLLADGVNWLVDPPDDDTWLPATIKIRYAHPPAAGAICRLADGSVRVRFDEPQTAVTPGQAAVFYSDDIVMGGGWIRAACHNDTGSA